MTKILLFIVLLFFIYCCSNSGKNRNEYICKENINVNVKEFKNNINASKDIFDSVWVVELEASPKSLISHCYRLISHNDRIIIFDYTQQAVFLFNKKGRFIHKINKIGRGPKEYTKIEDIHINLNNEIVLLDSPNDELFFFNFDGNYLRKERTSSNIKACFNLRKLSNSYTAYFTAKLTNLNSKITNHNLIIANDKNQLKFYFDNYSESEIKIMAPDNYLFRNSNFEIFYQNPYKNKIYNLKHGVPECELQINLSHGELPDKAFYSANFKQFKEQYYLNENFFLMIGSFQATLDHFIIPLFKGGEIGGNIIFSRSSNKFKLINKVEINNIERIIYARATEGNNIICIEDDFNNMVTGEDYDEKDLVKNPKIIFGTLKSF